MAWGRCDDPFNILLKQYLVNPNPMTMAAFVAFASAMPNIPMRYSPSLLNIPLCTTPLLWATWLPWIVGWQANNLTSVDLCADRIIEHPSFGNLLNDLLVSPDAVAAANADLVGVQKQCLWVTFGEEAGEANLPSLDDALAQIIATSAVAPQLDYMLGVAWVVSEWRLHGFVVCPGPIWKREGSASSLPVVVPSKANSGVRADALFPWP